MKIISHRGANQKHPENSIQAFEQALREGIDGLETDLLFTKDRVVICRHDDILKDSSGKLHLISNLTWEEVKTISDQEDLRIPLFESFWKEFASKSPITLDLKSKGMVDYLIEFFKKTPLTGGLHLTSFHYDEILKSADAFPNQGRSIVTTSLPLNFRDCLESVQANAISISREYITEDQITTVIKEGYALRIYSVNVFEEAQNFKNLGVNAIYTDAPEALNSLRT